MPCHICGQEAVERCYTCGNLFCEKHGSVNCQTCETAIAPGDRRDDHISSRRLQTSEGPAWWRPREAEDFEPPSCHICHGLARNRCRNCEQLYCGEHAGSSRLCRNCDRSSMLGLLLFFIGMALILVFSAWAVLSDR